MERTRHHPCACEKKTKSDIGLTALSSFPDHLPLKKARMNAKGFGTLMDVDFAPMNNIEGIGQQ